jgi:hypothetical protein
VLLSYHPTVLDYLQLGQYRTVFKDTNVTGRMLSAYCGSVPLLMKLGVTSSGHANLLFALLGDYTAHGVPHFVLHENHHEVRARHDTLSADIPVSYSALVLRVTTGPFALTLCGVYQPTKDVHGGRLSYVNTVTGARMGYDVTNHRWVILTSTRVLLAYFITANQSIKIAF